SWHPPLAVPLIRNACGDWRDFSLISTSFCATPSSWVAGAKARRACPGAKAPLPGHARCACFAPATQVKPSGVERELSNWRRGFRSLFEKSPHPAAASRVRFAIRIYIVDVVARLGLTDAVVEDVRGVAVGDSPVCGYGFAVDLLGGRQLFLGELGEAA